ncbi:winged helix-turn-helix domain-containing protein [Streptacidiphilus fuscans]|uniref:winged helix-turn-helix domain-containing protein n=1 Tax=Streptacidiphilus fuscans TaxID=2789292 RepID=UPI002E2C0A2C|nr:helix-turn-helix domain-containing protein [Streptacidiphilus fuscans]
MTVTYQRAHQHRELSAAIPPSRLPPAGRRPPVPAAVPPGIDIDRRRRRASAGGQVLDLTRREFDLLAHLVLNAELVFSRSQLLELVWDQPDVGDGRTVDVHVARLRRKLGNPYRWMVATVRGVGYKYDPAP